MKEITLDAGMVSYCGLYCGACKAYLKGKCPGCEKNEKASWCKIRKCCEEYGYGSCADCKEHDDVMNCKMFNNFVGKIFALIFSSNRKGSIDYIKANGIDAFVELMTEQKRMTVKK